jgi:hypothetical protein
VLLAAAEDGQAAIERAVVGQIDDALDRMQPRPSRALVDVRPGLVEPLVSAVGQVERDADVDAVVTGKELIGAPDLCECVDDLPARRNEEWMR